MAKVGVKNPYFLGTNPYFLLAPQDTGFLTTTYKETSHILYIYKITQLLLFKRNRTGICEKKRNFYLAVYHIITVSIERVFCISVKIKVKYKNSVISRHTQHWVNLYVVVIKENCSQLTTKT